MVVNLYRLIVVPYPKMAQTINEYLSEIGRRGGEVKGVPKGLAALSKERRKEIAGQGVAARKKKRKAK
jgi:hypothetical protein